MHLRRPRALLLMMATCGALSGPVPEQAGAAELPDYPDPQPIVPTESAAVADEGHSFIYNPAGPAFTRPSSFEFYQTFVPSTIHPGPGDVGRALFWSLPAFRLGFQYVSPEVGPGQGIVTFSQARVVGAKLGFGTSLNFHYFTNTETPLPGTLGINLGMMLRANPKMSFGLVFHNLLTPESPWEEFKTRATFGIGVRPFGDRFTVAADIGARLATLKSEPDARLVTTVGFEPIAGIRLHGIGEVHDLTGATPELLVGVGATLRVGRISLGNQGFIDVGGEPAPASDAFYIATHGKRAPTALTPGGLSGQIWMVTLKDGLNVPPSENSLVGAPYAVPLLYQVQRLRQALESPRARGVLLRIDSHSGSLADLQEIRALVVQLRERGKKVIAYLYQPKARDLYLASACDRILLHPAGEMQLEAPHRDAYYLKGLMDKVGVDAEVERRGAYKSAPEMYLAKEPSRETREMNRWLLEDLYQQLVSAIAEGRKLPLTDVTAAFDLQLLSAREAHSRHLVDDLQYPDELEPVYKQVFGRKYPVDEDDEYHEPLLTRWGPQQKIGVIYLGGTIQRVGGDIGSLLGDQIVSSKEAVEVLKKMEESRAVRAVVVRVDSPGGDVFASDELWHAVKKVQAKKPVIISMGGTAASGGYYLSVPAEAILADPATITGSIGVYTIKPNAQKLLEKFDVHTHTFTGGTRGSDLYSLNRPWTDEERKRVAAQIDENYQQFLQKVAEGRKLPLQAVEAVAEGRVWSGRQALEKKLVDQLGGLDDAIQLARSRGKIKPGQIVVLEVWPKRSLQDTLVGNVLTGSETGLIRTVLGTLVSSARRSLAPVPMPSYEAPDLQPLR